MHLPEGAGSPPRVGFAIGRKVGPAVVRNQVRRRLRTVFRELEARGGLSAGAYLVIVRPAAADRSQLELRGNVEHAMNRINKKVSA